MLEEGQASGRLTYVDEPRKGLPHAKVIFISVDIPTRPSGEPNERAAFDIAECVTGDVVVVEKRSVPVQTADHIKIILSNRFRHTFGIASNPEFVRAGRAVEDSFTPFG